jgi:hypothetical protein
MQDWPRRKCWELKTKMKTFAADIGEHGKKADTLAQLSPLDMKGIYVLNVCYCKFSLK